VGWYRAFRGFTSARLPGSSATTDSHRNPGTPASKGSAVCRHYPQSIAEPDVTR
jgi:hypothetical protein